MKTSNVIRFKLILCNFLLFFSLSVSCQTTITFETQLFECALSATEMAEFNCPFNGTLSVEALDVPEEILYFFEISEVVNGAFSFSYQLNAAAPEQIQLKWTVETSDDVTGCALPGAEINSTMVTQCLCFPAINTMVTHETCHGCNDGATWLDVSGMLGPFTYEWSNGETSYFQNNLAPGEYFLTVTGANEIECSITDVANIHPYECAVTGVKYGFAPIQCNASCDGIIDIQGLENGNEIVSVLWSDGATSLLREGLCPGSYVGTVRTEDNCPYIIEVTINEPALLEVEAKDITPANGPGTGSIVASANGGVTPYAYYITKDGESIEHDATESEIINLDAGCYRIEVIDNNGCMAAQDSVCVDNISSIQTISGSEFSIYPNPCDAYLSVKLDTRYIIQEIKVFNILGEKQKHLFDNNKVQVNHLMSGIYILDVVTDQGHWIQQFVKQ